MMKKYAVPLVFVFVVAFALNALWEFSHAPLYVHYRGGGITAFVLFRAALFDAVLITLLAAPMLFVSWLRARLWLSVIFGVLFAIGLELWALKTGRWEYTAFMPLVPLIKTGVTPTIQLGVTGWISYALAKRYT